MRGRSPPRPLLAVPNVTAHTTIRQMYQSLYNCCIMVLCSVVLTCPERVKDFLFWPVYAMMHVISFVFVKHLIGVYVELVDARGHKFGPDSDEVKEVVKQVDGELVRVLDALNETTNINLMVFSDHGMAERVGGAADDTSGLVNVLDYINSSDWKHAAGSEYATVLQIWPKSDNEDWVSLMKGDLARMKVDGRPIPERRHRLIYGSGPYIIASS